MSTGSARSELTRDEEPLVYAGVDGSWSLIRALGNLAELRRIDTVRRTAIGDVGQADATRLGLAGNESLPCI
jgi:hypothetical protein